MYMVRVMPLAMPCTVFWKKWCHEPPSRNKTIPIEKTTSTTAA